MASDRRRTGGARDVDSGGWTGVPHRAARAACSAAVDARAASALRTRCVLRAPRRGPGAHRFDAGSAKRKGPLRGRFFWCLEPESLAAPLARLARPRWTPGPLPPCARGACSGLQGAARALTDSTPAPPKEKAPCGAVSSGAWSRSPSLRRSRGLLGRGGRQGRFRPAHAVRAPGSKARPGRSPIRRRLRQKKRPLAGPFLLVPGAGVPRCAARAACSAAVDARAASALRTRCVLRAPRRGPGAHRFDAGSAKRKGPLRGRFFWCLEPESNQRHMDFQSIALPTELPRRELLD